MDDTGAAEALQAGTLTKERNSKVRTKANPVEPPQPQQSPNESAVREWRVVQPGRKAFQTWETGRVPGAAAPSGRCGRNTSFPRDNVGLLRAVPGRLLHNDRGFDHFYLGLPSPPLPPPAQPPSRPRLQAIWAWQPRLLPRLLYHVTGELPTVLLKTWEQQHFLSCLPSGFAGGRTVLCRASLTEPTSLALGE